MQDFQTYINWLNCHNGFTSGALWLAKQLYEKTAANPIVMASLMDALDNVSRQYADKQAGKRDDGLDSKLSSDPVQQGLERDIVGDVSDDAAGDTYLSTQGGGQ